MDVEFTKLSLSFKGSTQPLYMLNIDMQMMRCGVKVCVSLSSSRHKCMFSDLDPIGAPVVHPKLLNRDEEGDKVQEGGDPAVERVLVVSVVYVLL